jgi:hypothetical protein
MTATNPDDVKEAKIAAEQLKQIRDGLKAQLGPAADLIPDEKLTDPEFLARAAQMVQTGAVKVEAPKEPMAVGKVKELPGGEMGIDISKMDISGIMEMAGPMLKKFEDEMERQLAEIGRMRAGLKPLYDNVTHLMNELHAMNDGCLLAPAQPPKKK